MNPKIVVLDGYTLNPGDNPWDEVESLGDLTVHERTAPQDFLRRAASADILLTNKTPISREQIAALPGLKFISVLATGYNIVDAAAASERGIPVSNVPGYGTDSVAQHTLALMLELCNHVGTHAASTASGDWDRCPDFSYWKKPVRELRGSTLGIVGFGVIGQQVGALAHAFGMEILYTSRTIKENVAYPARRVAMDELFSTSDVVSLHCSQTPENMQFVNRDLLACMKPTAILINTARGALICEPDLARALEQGRLAGAALDVLSVEPPKPGNPLLHTRNCLVTPHIAWSGIAARQKLMQATAANIRSFLEGKPLHVVN